MTVVAVLAIAAIASGVTITGDKGGSLDVQITYLGAMATGGAAGNVDVYNVTLYAAAAGDYLTAVDLDIINGTSNLFQQAFFGGGMPSPDVSIFGNVAAAFDTHFNIAAAGQGTTQSWLAAVTASNENNDLSLGGGQGWGTSLNVVSGVTPAIASCDLANVAVAVGGNAVLTGDASAGDGEKFTFGPKSVSGITIPEPATIGLLALGGVGVLLRKRR
jgi:hypothetical protein